MANVFPFSPYYYSSNAGSLEGLVIPCNGTVTPTSRQRLIAAKPNSIAGILRGAPSEERTSVEFAKAHPRRAFEDLIRRRVLVKHPRSALFACLQHFCLPESNEKLTRKSVIGLAEVEPYESKVVFRHENTFHEKRASQIHFLREVRANLDPILMLYSDPSSTAEIIVDEVVAAEQPIMQVTDEDGVKNVLYEIAHSSYIEELTAMFMQKALLIADGHHRYEASLEFRAANPHLEDARCAMMAFTNAYGAGLRTLATHRTVSGIRRLDRGAFLDSVTDAFSVTTLSSLEELKSLFMNPQKGRIRIGVVFGDRQPEVILLAKARRKEIAVEALHRSILPRLFDADRRESCPAPVIGHVRGLDSATASVWSGGAQIGFLLEPPTIEEVFESTLQCGNLMPQKSTDFFPKMLTGLLIRDMEQTTLTNSR
jgi:uncharacterized protein (DUF1015 family)